MFRSKLESLLHNIGYTLSKADPDVWMRPEMKSDGTEYYKYSLVYVDDVLIISFNPMKEIKGIIFLFKLKGDKAEPSYMYLGESLEKVETKGGTKCWLMSAKINFKAAVVNLEARLAKR